MGKIAIVVQRYGSEINGGSETEAREYAERLTKDYEVDVITTCAKDYTTWKNEYKDGSEEINGVHVKRFRTNHNRRTHKFNQLSSQLYNSHVKDLHKEEEWMTAQGPVSTDLIDYIKNNRNDYDVVIFMTYLYYTTYFGVKNTDYKVIMIPTAHDEPPIYLSLFKRNFEKLSGIIYNTQAEQRFLEKHFSVKKIPSVIAGAGVTVPVQINADKFIEKYKIKDEFILYMGRIDESKGCKELFDYFIRYKKEYHTSLKLVLMGKAVMEIPEHSDIISLGFVSEEDKYNGLMASELLVMPSEYESLSIVLLEAMVLKKPVIANEKCEVLKDHCINSNAGLYYNGYYEFAEELSYILQNKNISEQLGKNGQDYVKNNYEWDTIINKIKSLIEKVKSGRENK
jgi:glycosyltransferase involved in cell wall biosynthesis